MSNNQTSLKSWSDQLKQERLAGERFIKLSAIRRSLDEDHGVKSEFGKLEDNLREVVFHFDSDFHVSISFGLLDEAPLKYIVELLINHLEGLQNDKQ